MTQSQLAYQAQAGDFLRNYQPHTNLNSFLSSFKPTLRAFFLSAQIITDVQFPDVSFYQGEIDFDVMATKTRAIILRAGQNLWTDIEFEDNYMEAKQRGIAVGVYWFYDDRIDPGRQADLLISLLQSKTLEMEIYIDWENSYGGPFKGLANVVAMMQKVEAANLRARAVGMYTGYYWFIENSNPISNASHYNYLKTRPLWLAWYSSNPANVLIPSPWTSLQHWQFGTPAVEWGQQSAEIDMNFFNGTREEFNVLYPSSTGTIPGETMAYYELRPTVATEYRSIRAQTIYPSNPHILGAKIAQINAGNFGKANEFDFYTYPMDVFVSGVKRAAAGDIWWKVFEANGVTISGWVAEIHLGVRYVNKTLVGGIPPSEEYVLHVKDGITRKFILE